MYESITQHNAEIASHRDMDPPDYTSDYTPITTLEDFANYVGADEATLASVNTRLEKDTEIHASISLYAGGQWWEPGGAPLPADLPITRVALHTTTRDSGEEFRLEEAVPITQTGFKILYRQLEGEIRFEDARWDADDDDDEYEDADEEWMEFTHPTEQP